MTTMRSYQVCECSAPLQLQEGDVPTPKGSEVVLEVLAAGVCHTDLHLWDGYYELGGEKRLKLADRGVRLPLTMGHENVGKVVAVGPGVEGVAIGDTRLVFPWIGCGSCKACKRGDENVCASPRYLGVFAQGGYATHLLVPHARHLFPIGRLSLNEAAPLACSGLTAYSALKKVSATLADEPVVVIGAGGVGLMAIMLARLMGAASIVVVDIDPAKREAAVRAGASSAIDGSASDAADQIKAATGGGASAVIDFVGSGRTVELAMASAAKGATLVIVGLFGGEINLATPMLPLRVLSLRGSYVGNHRDMAELLELVDRCGMPEVPLSTRPLSEVNTALNDLRAGKVVGRVVLMGER